MLLSVFSSFIVHLMVTFINCGSYNRHGGFREVYLCNQTLVLLVLVPVFGFDAGNLYCNSAKFLVAFCC